ncbi:hypothetical protein [Oceanobacillus picturae]|uniref:hypothetical protein n=1 Tax=Oceanobacillus picturae TaxID=171693 RepID=UPI0036321B9D
MEILGKLISMQVLIALISSSVISAFITSIFVKLNNDRNLQLKYITEERQKWRNQIKENVSLLVSNSYENDKELKRIVTFLLLSVNPNDEEDVKIINCLNNILINNNDDNEKNKLIELIQQLLKHDWERAKKESSAFNGLMKKKYIRKKVHQ